jgi:hypothetical protein
MGEMTRHQQPKSEGCRHDRAGHEKFMPQKTASLRNTGRFAQPLLLRLMIREVRASVQRAPTSTLQPRGDASRRHTAVAGLQRADRSPRGSIPIAAAELCATIKRPRSGLQPISNGPGRLAPAYLQTQLETTAMLEKRDSCPACQSRQHAALLQISYSSPEVLDFLCAYYDRASRDSIRARLEGGTLSILECTSCRLNLSARNTRRRFYASNLLGLDRAG